jgi:hypothetical protein
VIFSPTGLGYEVIIINPLHAVVIKSWRSKTCSKAARKRNGNLPEMLTWGVFSFLLKNCLLSKDQLQTDSGN